MTAASVLRRVGVPDAAALEFLIDMARAAQRQLAHDNEPGLMWLYQVEAAARVKLARLRETR